MCVCMCVYVQALLLQLKKENGDCRLRVKKTDNSISPTLNQIHLQFFW